MSEHALNLSESSPLKNNEDFKQLLQNLKEEELKEVVIRFAKDKSITITEASKVRDNFFQFISLTKISNNPISPPMIVDEFWHKFLIFTRQYQNFCDKHFGHFIHHEPLSKELSKKNNFQETSKLLWDNFNAVACCNNTCDADWPTIRG